MRRPLTWRALGTTASLLVTDDAVLDVARELLVTELAAIDIACSRFRADSELALVNANAGRATDVSPLFVEALQAALRAARLTGGLVDPTVGTAVRVLGYDRDFDDVDRSGPPLAVTVRRVPGWQTVELDRGTTSVRIPPGVELDFGATAKALCADRAATAIAAATGAGVLVSLGGDVAMAGPPPMPGWSLFVTDDHEAAPGATGQRIVVGSGGVATSGTVVRRWHRGAEALHHIINPASGRPANEHWRTASVAARTCVDANIASTAAIVMGAGAAEWLGNRRLPARLVSSDGEVVRVGDWPGEVGVAC